MTEVVVVFPKAAMQCSSTFLLLKKLYGSISCRNKTAIPSKTQTRNFQTQYDVFINHRGVDTKRNIAVLLYNNLKMHNIHTFLDYKTMKPGDKLLDTINSAICGCKIGVVLFSPRYCESYNCLHELALLVERKKKLIPIFCNVKKDQLRIIDDEIAYQSEDVEKLRYALEEGKSTVGIEFNTSEGDWLQLLEDVSASIIKNLSDIDKISKKGQLY